MASKASWFLFMLSPGGHPVKVTIATDSRVAEPVANRIEMKVVRRARPVGFMYVIVQTGCLSGRIIVNR